MRELHSMLNRNVLILNEIVLTDFKSVTIWQMLYQNSSKRWFSKESLIFTEFLVPFHFQKIFKVIISYSIDITAWF